MANDEEFLVDLNPIPSVTVKSGKDIQKFNGSWYRGNSTNFIPSKKLLNQPNSIKEYILKGYFPSKPFIEKDTVITAFGSCFAQHITKHLISNGFNVLGKKLKIDSHIIRFGEGIVNTFAILEQLDWAFNNKNLSEGLWFGNNKEVVIPDENIRVNTKNLLLKTRVLIITIGLSEIWYDKQSNRVFWRAVPANIFDNKRHGFRNSTVEENSKNLKSIISIIRDKNPECKIIFTLSPIPLMATFRKINCISANTISKAILRVALDSIDYGEKEGVFYFPSYELVKEVFVDPYKDDNRHIKEVYTDQIMSIFENYYCVK